MRLSRPMKSSELKADVRGELEQMHIVVRELVALRSDVRDRAPMLREKVAGAGFLAQFYNGVENILKRISKYHHVAPPEGDRWHVQLFDRFCGTSSSDASRELPVLFDEHLASEMAQYRGFRHVARASYGIELNWQLMAQGIDRVEETHARFEQAALRYLNTLDAGPSRP